MGEERQKAPWLDAADIKRRVPLESVLEAYGLTGSLRRRGESFTGSSPFRKGDSTPSFSANVERGIWNDGGGRPVIEGREVPGNVIGLVQALEGCSFREALEKLHARFIAGASPEDAFTQHTRGVVGAALRAEKVAERQDGNKPFGKELGGLRYELPWLQETKGITVETAKRFGVGYCSRGLMKGRVVFPIRNHGGAIVAYAGRSMKEDDEGGKYRFPTGFQKLSELYNIDRIASDDETRAVVAERGLVVVKGFTDVLRLNQNGVPNAVALMGNEFGDGQLALLTNPHLNPSGKVTLFLDDSEAGNACKRRLAAALIHRAYVRYANHAAAGDPSKIEPEQFLREELKRVLW